MSWALGVGLIVGDDASYTTHGTGFPFIVEGDTIRITTKKTIEAENTAGNQGEICFNDSRIFVCTAANTWKFVPLQTF